MRQVGALKEKVDIPVKPDQGHGIMPLVSPHQAPPIL